MSSVWSSLWRRLDWVKYIWQCVHRPKCLDGLIDWALDGVESGSETLSGLPTDSYNC